MHFRNFSDMSRVIRENIHKIPQDIDVVAGIPRSGMVPAGIIATLLNKPLASAGELLLGVWRPNAHGGRWKEACYPRRILLVDDSISGGQTIGAIGAELCQKNRSRAANVQCLAIYRKGLSPSIAESFETVPGPRVFEWNWYRHKHVTKAVLDIDGVISTPTKPGERLQGRPLFIPKYAPLALATGRPEKDRDATEVWLRSNNVPYTKLFMSAEGESARSTKLRAFNEVKPDWIVESDAEQAAYLRIRTGVSVLCTDTNTML